MASRPFRQSPRSREFLAFVVNETLSGREARLKERTLGRAVLGLPATYDVASDSRVRVQATRVRRALAEYYEDEGAQDPVEIALPVGAYRPGFRRREPRVGISGGGKMLKPAVVVVEFVDLDLPDGSSAAAAGLTESLLHALRNFPAVRTIGPLSQTGPGPELGRPIGVRTGARYVLQGTVRAREDVVRVSVRLSDTRTDEVVWSDVLDRDLRRFTGFGGEDDIVEAVAAVVGDYQGAVVRHEVQAPSTTQDPVVYQAMLTFYDHLARNSRPSAEAALPALREAVAIEPSNPMLHAMAGSVLTFRVLAGWSPDPHADLLEARTHATTALSADPGCGHAHIVLAKCALAEGTVDEAEREARLVVAQWPNHPSLLYSAGYLLANVPHWDEAIGVIQRAVQLNPGHPAYWATLLALDAYLRGDDAQTLALAAPLREPDKFWGPTLRALALRRLGYGQSALRERADAQATEPDLLGKVRTLGYLPDHAKQRLLADITELLADTA